MKIFIWSKDFMRDYSSGIGVVAAESIDQARELLLKEITERGLEETYGHDVEAEPDEIFDLEGPRVIATQTGGG